MAREKAPDDVNDKAQRRVYVLPNELVERVADYQKRFNLNSEVEAVRRLLDNALKAHDTPRRIVDRVYAQHAQSKPLDDAIRDVIWGHPLLKSINVSEEETIVRFKSEQAIVFNAFGSATLLDENDHPVRFNRENPNWASPRHGDPYNPKQDSMKDDIPF